MSDDDDHIQKKLDLEFRRILRVIKPYIPCIMNNDYLFSYRMWLEKLSEARSSEKSERNRYLVELCRQIQDGILEKPFQQLPNSGPLPPFQSDLEPNKQSSSINKNTLQNVPTKDLNVKMSKNSSELNDAKILQNGINMKTINFAKLPGQLFNQITQHKKRNRLTVLRETEPDNNNPKLDFIWRVPETFGEESPSQCTSNLSHQKEKVLRDSKIFNLMENKLNEKHQNCTNQEEKIQKKINSYYTQKFNELLSQQKNTGIKLNKDSFENDSSWYDLSDVSSSTVSKGFGDSEEKHSEKTVVDQLNHKFETSSKKYDSKINEIATAVSNYQSRSSTISNDNPTKFEHELILRNTKAETSMHYLADEVELLKTRLKELTDMKASLKTNEGIASAQWQNKVNTLQKKLYSSQNHITILKSEITSLEKKLDEFTSIKQKELTCLRDKLTELHNQEIDMLKEHHVKQMSNIESKFSSLVNERENEFAQKLTNLKNVHDTKLAEIGKEYEFIIQQRNNEISRLESMVENKCKRMHEEVRGIRSQMEEKQSYANNDHNLEKIGFLQKCIGRMDKLFKKSEKDYGKQIIKLKQEISVRDKSLQLQLAAQKAELVSVSNSSKHEEIDNLVQQLEERYKKLLEIQQTYFITEKQQDTNLIAELRSMVAKTCEDYDTFGVDM